jgi:alkylated DNA repair dioxygenase AlkB
MSYTKEVFNLTDGAQVIYIKKFISIDVADALFEELLTTVNWEKFMYTVGDKEVESPRFMQIVNLDEDLEDLPLLEILKKRIEKKTHRTYDYAVLNYYRNGRDYISYHADREVKPGSLVVSVSLGTKRKFVLKHKINNKLKFEFMLGNGHILVLNEAAIKTSFKHSVPKMTKVTGARISITFRE